MKEHVDPITDLINAHRSAESHRQEAGTNRYPEDFKRTVRRLSAYGLSLSKMSQATGVSIATLSSWLKQASPQVREIGLKDTSICKTMVKLEFPSGLRLELASEPFTTQFHSWLRASA